MQGHILAVLHYPIDTGQDIGQDSMDAQIDSLTIKDFESRYNIARSNVNNRLSGLKGKGYDMDPEKGEGGKNVYNADQIALMDQLHDHLKAGGTIATFPAAGSQTNLSYVSQDSEQLSYRTQDTNQFQPIPPPANFGLTDFSDAIALKVAALLQPPTTDTLANLRQLQEACDRGWLLSSSQLAPLVGLKTLHGKAFERFGFRFMKVGRNGSQGAWRVEKVNESL